MPLTPDQEDEIRDILLLISNEMRPIVTARINLMALTRIHPRVSADHGGSLTAIISHEKNAARKAARNLVQGLLGPP